MKVICRIKNCSNDNYPEIVARKLYQKIFWENNLQTFTIYTALVIGVPASTQGMNGIKKNFQVEISFQAIDGNEHKIDVKYDIKDRSKSLVEEINPWRGVWGIDTKLINTPDEFCRLYRELFDKNVECSDAPRNKYIYIKENEKKSIARIAEVKEPINNSYYIEAPEELKDNIDIITFTSTTFTLEAGDTDFDYVIEFCEGQKITCEDNSVFFVLPNGYRTIRTDLTIYNKADTEESFNNAFNEIRAKVQTKYLKEWIKKGVFERRYYRVTEKAFKSSIHPKGFVFNISIEDEKSVIIKKVIYSLAISTFFSYGLDQDRLNNFESLYLFSPFVVPDINFIAVYTIFFLNIVMKLNVGRAEENTIFRSIRVLGFVSVILWTFVIYCYASTIFYTSRSGTYTFIENLIFVSHALNFISLLLNSISLAHLYIKHRKEFRFSVKESLRKLL